MEAARRKKEVNRVEKTVGLGHQDFRVIREENCFYIDKYGFAFRGKEVQIGEKKTETVL